jgi:hypothetical protein
MTTSAAGQGKFRRGSASIYVVIFTTLLLTVTTGSFIRIVLRDNIGSIKLDSSQSALDAAKIGIEDAKIALLKYHRCLTEGLTGTITTGDGTVNCNDVIAIMRDDTANTDCNIVQKILGQDYVAGSEIPIGTKTNLTDAEVQGEYLDQAISCVLINEEKDDYRAALANSDPPQSKLVPLRTTSTKQITHVKIQWFAHEDGAATSNAKGGDDNNKKTGNDKNTAMLKDIDYNTQQQPSPLYVQLLQAYKDFSISDFYMSEGQKTDSAAVLFVPKSGARTTPTVPKDRFAASNDKTPNQPIPVGCADDGNYHCSAIIELPEPINGDRTSLNGGASFLRLMIPYGNPYTQYSVQLCADSACVSNNDGVCDPGEICFTVQSTISSTGRAGETFRRLEERVEFVDNKFPLPQYALNLDSEIVKNFYVTRNNWGGDNAGEVPGLTP